METQLNLLVQLGTVFIIIFGLFVFMVGAVIIAEFIRRERTSTKEDDWFERTDKVCTWCSHDRSSHRNGCTECSCAGFK